MEEGERLSTMFRLFRLLQWSPLLMYDAAQYRKLEKCTLH